MEKKTMNRYTFSNGDVITSALPKEEIIKRCKRLDTLCVLVEQHECPVAKSIYQKALRAFNKANGFTGIIRLTFTEKDWLSYMLENENITDEDIEVLNFYCK